MTTLARELRNELERTVRDARRIAEAGAGKALGELGVGEPKTPPNFTKALEELRSRLRAHGRQLGDKRNQHTNGQETARLRAECAYEHWHRMLFARFLAENALLIEPNTKVAITLEECQQLARERGKDWVDLTSEFAVRMLPQIFRQGDPVLEVTLPPETRSKLEDLLKALPLEVFLADDSLGWVYQFWQADRKKEINDSEGKIGADEIAAVTQFFTDDYMVRFLLHNTLGAWWAAKILSRHPHLATMATSENELRAACAVGGVELTYLRFVREDGARWRPAAGTFNGWPRAAKEITLLDPCMGSGHFLVFALPILVAFRVEEEHLSREQAVEAVLRDNLFGLEIDPRCTQIAAFNLAFAAWRMVGYRLLPPLNLACSGLPPGVSKPEWLKLADRAAATAPVPPERNLFGSRDNLFSRRIKAGIERLYDLFAKAPWLGSLVDPRVGEAPLAEATFKELEPVLSPMLAKQRSDEVTEIAVTAQGMAKSSELLGCKFVLVATNVPYLATRRQSKELQDFCTHSYSDSKNDLALIFLSRCVNLIAPGGTLAAIVSQYWLFKSSYENSRRDLLKRLKWDLIARLGTGAFEAISGEVVNVCAGAWTNTKPPEGHMIFGWDLVSVRLLKDKIVQLKSGTLRQALQSQQLSNPQARMLFGAIAIGGALSDLAIAPQGVKTGDDERWRRRFWEIPPGSKDWLYYQSTVRSHTPYGGRHLMLDWRSSGVGMIRPRVHNAALGKKGVAISQSGGLAATIYTGERFDSNVAPIVPRNEELLPALWAYCTSDEYRENVRQIDQSLKVTNVPLLQVPFDAERWARKAKESGGIPEQRSDDPTQWVFHGHPRSSIHPLQVAAARLVSYKWPAELEARTLSSEARSLVADAGALTRHVAVDGIACFSPVKGQSSAAERLGALLAEAFGVQWSAAKLSAFLTEVGFGERTLEDWLRDGFFAQHCDLFQQLPFIWHVWDGRRDGFNALVSYHRLAGSRGEARSTLEKLIYSYLVGWIDLQHDHQKKGVDGADARLAAAMHLKTNLENIFEGESPYDIFARWKPLRDQPIGWEPDIYDGVRVNIRPFINAKPLLARASDACILRVTPRIDWEKDGGKEQLRSREDFPWYWGRAGEPKDFGGGKSFDGNRWNDLHYTNAFKRAAREQNAAPPAKARR
jgi:hypothetical protein